MDEKWKKSCPNCCQLYTLKTLAPEPKSNIPLFLKCGHSMCEACIRNIVKFGEPIECKICHREMEIKTTDIAKLLQNKIQLYKLFPVNVTMLGELTLELIAEKPQTEKSNDDFFIDLEAILASKEQTLGQCLECLKVTGTMCHQCATIICGDCFDKSHKNFVVFKSHFLQNIEVQLVPNNCETHCDKSLDYYCKDCDKSVCTDCLMVGAESCKSHNVVPTVEMNKMFIDDLREISPQVGAIFRRLTKTAVDIGNILHNIESDSGSSELKQVSAVIEQHFSKLYAEIQNHKEEVMNIIARLKAIEKDSLVQAKEEVAKAIKESKTVMSSLKAALDCENNKSVNLSTLLDDAKKILTKPWYLSKDISTKNTLKVTVSEDLCMLISDYIHLEGNAKALYKLRATHELDGVDIPPPPHVPVYPPQLPKDVRLDKPKEVSEKSAVSREIPLQPKNSVANNSFISKENSQTLSPELKKTAVQPVMPFAENNPLYPLKAVKEGKQELARVTHIVDPDNFFVQRACDEAILNEMMEELPNNLRDIHRDISVGAMYVVNKNDTWMRCRVESIDVTDSYNPTYHVTCVDYGTTVSATIADLRDAPASFTVGTTRGRYPSPLAIRCRLANCKPKDGVWSNSDTDLVRNIIGNKQVIIHVRAAGAVNECDVTTLDGVSVAHALLFHGRAALIKPYLPYPEIRGIAEKPKLYISNNNLNSKSCEDVLITHVAGPDKFFVREVYLQDDFNKLCDELNQEYNITDTSGSIYLPETGMVCVVHTNKEENLDHSGWARAIVKSVKECQVDVYLPDIGNTIEVSWDRLRRIKQKFTVLRGLVSECHLAGLNHYSYFEATLLLEQYKGRTLKLNVDKKHNRKTVGAVLICESDKEIVCINQELVLNKIAVATGSVDFDLLNPNKTTEKAEKVREPNTPNSYEKVREPNTSTSHVKVTKPKSPTMPKTDQIEAKDAKSPLRLEAKILHYESPSLIYISLMHQQKTFIELFEDIQKFYSKRKTPRRHNWKVNDRCCAFCIQSETWRRATILEVLKDCVKVFYTDFACSETVPISNLKRLHSDFEVIGDAAIKCHLAGVLPASSEWPTITKEYLKERLDSYTRAFITKVGQFKDKSMPIELWVYHTVQGSALEPDRSEWRCLNKEIISQGLGLPDKSLQTENFTTMSKNGEDEMLAFLNLTGSVSDYLLIPPSRGTPLMSSEESNTSSPMKIGDDLSSFNTLFISDWLPAEPLTTTEFTGVPTYIDNDGVIYLHDITQQEIFELIRDTLEIGFKEQDPKAQYYTWRVGEPCVARYYLDNNFYRGTVVEVNKDEGNCLIHYVDYGNNELCTFADLRKGIALHQIPIQAHKCSLSRIKPKEDKWELNVLDYIHKAIVEKKCFVKVVGEPVDGITPIDLKYDKLWINDHLVEFDMATFTDGSKPKVRKFSPIKRTKAVKPEPVVIEVNTNEEPDFIVDDENLSSEASASPDSFKLSTLVDRDSKSNDSDEDIVCTFISYPKHDVEEFDWNITVINDTNSLELGIVRNEETIALYDALYETVEVEGENMPALDGVFENKACIALFPDDNKWYRALILKYSESKNLIKVRYVDYGNIGVIPLDYVKEINEEWAKLPPATISVTLHGVTANPTLDTDEVTKVYVDTFLDKGPFHAKIVGNKDSLACVELRNDDQELVYKEIIEQGVFLNGECENCT